MPAASYDVLAIGNAIVDIMRRCDDALIKRMGGAKGHMTLVPSPSVIAAVHDKLSPGVELAGGAAAITAVGIASFGGKAGFIGRVADDEFGRIFQHDIRSAGVVFTTLPTTVPGKQTSRALILVTPDGRRTMYTFLGCSTELDQYVIDAQTIGKAKIVLLEGYLFDRPEAKAAFRHAVSLANAAGKMVALSLSDKLCVQRHRAEFRQLVRSGVSVLFANQDEIQALYETASFDEAARLAGRDAKLAVLTRGAAGSVIVAQGHTTRVPPEPVAKIIDATGAGDLYASGFLYALARGMDHASAGRLGSFAASEIIRTVGTRPEARLGHLARLRGLIR